ncbi:MAG: excinuclease ABC subunit C [Flavobacteriales bacterium CG_4_9_14_3_um_filter_40_17]|nr:MAG: excinuclease ABC subunit C [Flavobacteriales bacterium CG_4_9_14_3_um_filter_40_17]
MSYHVYILYSKELDNYYVGHTGDSLESRLRKHLSNHHGFTARAIDWIVVYKELLSYKVDAFQRGHFIKSQKSRKFIENLISVAVW